MVANKQQIIEALKQNKNELEKFGVERVGVFGSFVREEQTKFSDIDLLVEFEKGKKTFRNFIGTADFAESILGRKVDLVTQGSLSPYIAPHIKKEIEYVQIT